jgi:hypothetical protein
LIFSFDDIFYFCSSFCIICPLQLNFCKGMAEKMTGGKLYRPNIQGLPDNFVYPCNYVGNVW